MAAQKPHMRSIFVNDNINKNSNGKVIKKKFKARPGTSLRRRDGLLNAAIPARSDLMKIAKRNSVGSALLMLPAEIRNKIWKYAVGYHQIDITHHVPSRNSAIQSSCEIRPLHENYTCQQNFTRPTFQLLNVCRQIYVETSAMIYTLNTFGFKTCATFDRWFKRRSLGQKRLVASVDMPFDYMRLYRDGDRKLFREKFPNIKRIGVELSFAYYTHRIEYKTLDMAKKRVVSLIKENEGDHVEIAWQSGAT